MEIITKHYYTDGTEIKKGDMVYLKGHDSNRGVSFAGICKVYGLRKDLLSAYFLGQQIGGIYDIEMYVQDIDKLIKLDNRDIDKAVEKEMLKL